MPDDNLDHLHDLGFEEIDDEEDDFGDACGRWDNGRLGRHCTMAGTEFCDWECPYRNRGNHG